MAAPGGRARWGATLRSTWFKAAAAVTAAAALAAGAFLSAGYDTAQTKVDDSSVWVLQAGQGQRYARVNTTLGQVDTVKSVTSPSDLVQAAGRVMLFTQNNARVADVDPAQPADFTSQADNTLHSTPDGTDDVVNTGDFVGYRSNTGEVTAERIESGPKSALAPVPDPGSGGKRPFSADVIAIGTDGILYAYSHTSKTVLRFDIAAGRSLGADAVRGGPTNADGLQLTVVGSTWALLDPANGRLWVRGLAAPVSTGLSAGALLQQPSGRQNAVVAADATQLLAFELKTGAKDAPLARLGDGAVRVPAAPIWQGSKLYAAWLNPGRAPGEMWVGAARLDGPPRTSQALTQLGNSSTPASLPSNPKPVFRSNGSRVLLNDASSGWAWSVPSARVVEGSQNWDIESDKGNTSPTKDQTAPRESDPKPPTAVDDRFGVRAGALVTLPVMLNDTDPNGDVLSIVPGSVTGLDKAFGTATIANSNQTVTVQVGQDPPPTATFQYTITDGTTADGLNSSPATVTLSLATGADRAPVWCNGVSDCPYPWPGDADGGVPVAPGGALELPILRGWVDPDGDPMFATVTSPPTSRGAASVSPDGDFVYKAKDTAPEGPDTVMITVTDIYGKSASRQLVIRVTPSPKMTVQDFGVMTAQGVPITVDPSSHIYGAKGTPQIVNAALPTTTTGANVSVDSSGATFQFQAANPGSYAVTMTVKDAVAAAPGQSDAGGGTTATAIVRVTVVSAKQPQISTAPVTVFVRPDRDASVDVFSAVQNPTGRVLLLSNPLPRPAAQASLDVDVVGQSQLRVRGDTGDSQPGLLGTVDYTVSDGASVSVQGTATVYLLAAAVPVAPVAIDDSVTVRAGAQVDVPVLANDVGVSGDLIELDPTRVGNVTGKGIAFASGQLLRILAPATAGTYTLTYWAYSAGNPQQEVEGHVEVTVLAQGSDRAPRPVTLTGRVAAGATVRIPFDSFGIDPDGDMVALDRVGTPQRGTAQITADGTAISYTARQGDAGQDSFQYRVRDAEGEYGTGTVMIGVLGAKTDPAPVTFSDYVQVQVGADNHVNVQPTLNDVDPNDGALTLRSVDPNAPSQNPRFEELQRHLSPIADNAITIASSDTVETLTYTYTVENDLGDVSAGLIVVDVVSGKVPDWPVAQDTIVDAQSRSHLDQGIDVVSGKVSWATGDAASLKLSLPNRADGVSLGSDGRSIKVARVPAAGLIVPFLLSGPQAEDGTTPRTYGFLRVPAAAEVILTLKSSFRPWPVREGEQSTPVDLVDDAISAPAGTALQFDKAAPKTTGARPGSSCAIEDGGKLVYTAGKEAPWTDACVVGVRPAAQPQDDFTYIAVPFAIEPIDPEPQLLESASLTSSPGLPAVVYNLTKLVTWPRHTAADIAKLRFQVSVTSGDQQFSVVQNGSALSVKAADSAQQGRESTVTVTLVDHPSTPKATIDLRVGPAPSTLPTGGSASLSCSEASGTSCDVAVVGLPNETNQFPGTPLKVVRVAASVAGCPNVAFSVEGTDRVKATWTGTTPGGTCTVPFDVMDAQGRQSATGSGSGRLAFELKGFPAAPASVAQVAYGDDSVTLAVSPGDAATAYPPIAGFVVTMDGSPVSKPCSAQGVCSPIRDLANGAKHTFQVRAVNDVGSSKGAVSTVGWAFAQPFVAGVTAEPVYDSNVTSATSGAFDLTIPNRDSAVKSYHVAWAGSSVDIPATSQSSVTKRLSAPTGGKTQVSVIPVSQFSVPPGDPLNGVTGSAEVTTAGTPSFTWSGAITTTNDSIAIAPEITTNANGSAKSPSQPVLYIATENGDPQCSNAGGDSIDTNGKGVQSTSPTIGGLTQFHTYDVYACYTNEYGIAEKQLKSGVTVWNKPPAPQGWTFDIRNHPSRQYLIDYDYSGRAPGGGAVPPNYVARFQDPASGGYQPQSSYRYPQSVWGQDPAIQVQYCGNGFASLCTDPADVVPASGSAPYRLRVSGVAAVCTATESKADPDAGADATPQPTPTGGSTPPPAQPTTVTTLSATLSMQGDGLNGSTVLITAYSYLDSSNLPQSVVLDKGSYKKTVTLKPGETSLQITGYQITLPSGFGQPFTGGAGQITQDPVCAG